LQYTETAGPNVILQFTFVILNKYIQCTKQHYSLKYKEGMCHDVHGYGGDRLY
jgi:hypothetical protein